MKRTWTVLIIALALVAAACGGSDNTTTPADDGNAVACGVDDLALKTPGTLTVATGEPVFPPWMEDDDPTNGEGFESAVVYAVATEMGIANVEWVRTEFDAAISAGEKDYDFNIQQYSITEERDQIVDFSRPYYSAKQALVGFNASVVAEGATVADLKDLRFGAAIGTTSLSYIDDVIKPITAAAVYNDTVDAKSALEAGQIDVLVMDLPTAYYITAVEIEGSEIVGVLPGLTAAPEELGMLFEEGSKLVPCVNKALDSLDADGTLAKLETQWLNQGGDITVIQP